MCLRMQISSLYWCGCNCCLSKVSPVFVIGKLLPGSRNEKGEHLWLTFYKNLFLCGYFPDLPRIIWNAFEKTHPKVVIRILMSSHILRFFI